MNTNIIIIQCLLAVIILSLLLGCEKPDEPVVKTYQEEMISFISDSQDGREMFPLNVYPTTPFRLNNLDVQYHFDSVTRGLDVKISGGPKNIYGFNSIYDAVVTIQDRYYGRINKIVGDQTTLYYPLEINLNRYAYFLKIYNDSYEYRGWRFWGYSVDNKHIIDFGSITGGDKTISAFFEEARPVFSLGYYFIRKNNIQPIPSGSYLNYNKFDKFIVFAETSDGIRRTVTSQWRTPSATNSFYRLITIIGPLDTLLDTIATNPPVIDTSLLQESDVVIPYKVEY